MSSQTIKPQTLKGFRDFLPVEKRKRDYVTDKIKRVFELYGFEPLETPTLEYASLLTGKYGKEADKLIYTFKDKGDRSLGLRYDQTIPTARVLAQYQNILPKYFRRYQIQNVYRADKPQKGRYREFTQCDIDIFGSASPLSDAEIITTTYFAFKAVGYPKIKISINDRQILFDSLKQFETDSVNIMSIIQSIDKLEKVGEAKVIEELIKKGLTESSAKTSLSSIRSASLSLNLKNIIKYIVDLGIPKEDIVYTPTLARGLDYYTGMIFEIVLPGYEVGSCGGGGRYDKLIGQLGGVDIPAVGIAFGFDRMVEAADSFKLIPASNISSQVLITVFSEEYVSQSLKLADILRKETISTEVFPSVDKLDKQLKYANRKGIPYVIIIGPEEVKQNIVKIKNMKTGVQTDSKLAELIDNLKL